MLLRFVGFPGRKLFISHATKKMWSIHILSKLRLEQNTSLWASAYLAVVQMFVFALNFVNCLYKWCVLVNFYCTYYQICVSRFSVIYDALASLYVVILGHYDCFKTGTHKSPESISVQTIYCSDLLQLSSYTPSSLKSNWLVWLMMSFLNKTTHDESQNLLT